MRGSVLAVVLLACVAVGAWLALRGRRLHARWQGQVRNVRGKKGERDAERLLSGAGYRVVARQLRTSYAVRVDGAVQQVELVLDFVVERDGEQLVAEVKTGNAAPRIERAETRRQLLEYQIATAARRVLLVDADNETITEVAFPNATGAARSGASWTWAVMIALLAAAAWWLQRR